MTAEELIERYLHELTARSPRFREGQGYLLRRFNAYCAEKNLVSSEQIRFEHLVAYARKLVDQNLAEYTRYQMVAAVRRWLKWAVRRGHLLADPTLDWQPRHPKPLFRAVPTERQMLSLLDSPPKDTLQGLRDRTLLEFLYGTGLRVQECAQVTLLDLELREQTVTVRGKGGKVRWQPLGPRLVGKLREYLDNVRPALSKGQTMALFLNDQGTPMLVHSIAARLRLYSQQIGSTHFSVHSIRHAFATHLLLSGAPIYSIQKLLGHDSIASTALYTRLLPLDLQAELNHTHPRAKRRGKKAKPKET